MRIDYVFVVVTVFQIKFYLLGSLISHTLLGDQHTIDYYEVFSLKPSGHLPHFLAEWRPAFQWRNELVFRSEVFILSSSISLLPKSSNWWLLPWWDFGDFVQLVEENNYAWEAEKKDTYFHSELEDSPFSTLGRTPETLLQPSISCLPSLSFSAFSPIPDNSPLPHTVGESAEFGRSKLLPMTWHSKLLKQAICYHGNWLLIIFYKYLFPQNKPFISGDFWKNCINNRVFHTTAIKIKIYWLKILLANQMHIWMGICI